MQFAENTLLVDHDLIDMAGARFTSLFRMGEGETDTVLFRTKMAPGKYVPLHNHFDPECLCVISGSIEVFTINDDPRWHRLGQEQSILLTHGIKHALRNATDDEADVLVATNTRLANYFRDAGRQVPSGSDHTKPTPDDIARMIRVSEEYGYWMSTPPESMAITG